MEIVDVNGRKKMIKDGSLKVVVEDVPDQVNGGIIKEKFISVVVVGRVTGREWKEFYPLADFQRENPIFNVG